MEIQIKEVDRNDLKQLLELYTQLHDNAMPEMGKRLETLWDAILSDRNHHIIGAFVAGRIISSCVVLIVPNLTHMQRPYALVENVITDQAYRNQGYATSVLNFAREIAKSESCYKIMLMTSSKEENILRFYEKAGYNQKDKTAMIQWL